MPLNEEMLIWSGYLDGEVGRIALADFEKSVKAYQATLALGMPPGDEQRAALQKRVSSIATAGGSKRRAIRRRLSFGYLANCCQVGRI
jgi:hypothetical protein